MFSKPRFQLFRKKKSGGRGTAGGVGRVGHLGGGFIYSFCRNHRFPLRSHFCLPFDFLKVQIPAFRPKRMRYIAVVRSLFGHFQVARQKVSGSAQIIHFSSVVVDSLITNLNVPLVSFIELLVSAIVDHGWQSQSDHKPLNGSDLQVLHPLILQHLLSDYSRTVRFLRV